MNSRSSLIGFCLCFIASAVNAEEAPLNCRQKIEGAFQKLYVLMKTERSTRKHEAFLEKELDDAVCTFNEMNGLNLELFKYKFRKYNNKATDQDIFFIEAWLPDPYGHVSIYIPFREGQPYKGGFKPHNINLQHDFTYKIVVHAYE